MSIIFVKILVVVLTPTTSFCYALAPTTRTFSRLFSLFWSCSVGLPISSARAACLQPSVVLVLPDAVLFCSEACICVSSSSSSNRHNNYNTRTTEQPQQNKKQRQHHTGSVFYKKIRVVYLKNIFKIPFSRFPLSSAT